MTAERAGDAGPARTSTARGAEVGMTTGAVLGALVYAELFVRLWFRERANASSMPFRAAHRPHADRS
jgi:hypothetical protein